MSSELAQKDLVDENFEEFEDANDVIPSNVPKSRQLDTHT